ncbi:MAG: GNAT family N-acetyltransferase [Parcubacteria group bacterium]|jgi:ribosomal protein S18 acetylase RimI-like enzyme
MKSKNFLVYNYIDYSPRKKQLRKKQLVDFYNENFSLSKWSEKYFNGFLDDKKERKMECFILEKNNKIIGFILGRKVGKIRFRYNLTTLLVDEKYRGKGYSKLLMDKFLKTIKENKEARKVYLHFRDSNDFEGFYKHYGFSGHRITGAYSNGEKKHYMEIKL